MSKRKTHEQYENELFEKEIDYWPLDRYINDSTPINHKCLNDHVWKARPNTILKGNGCPYCAKNKKKTTKEYNSFLPKDITLMENYINDSTPILHKHICGHQWKARPTNILNNNTSCPNCAKNSLNFNKPASLYLVSFSYLGEIYYKIGITSVNIKDRYKGEWNKYNMQLIYQKPYATGREAYKEEQKILVIYDEYRINTGLLHKGNTETFSCYLPIKNGF